MISALIFLIYCKHLEVSEKVLIFATGNLKLIIPKTDYYEENQDLEHPDARRNGGAYDGSLFK